MRPKIIAGNWKMNKDSDEAVHLLTALKAKSPGFPKEVLVVVCPPFPSLALAKQLLEGTAISVGAQNMHSEDEGAFTGEVSAKMLLSVGCKYVILGHSERRQLFGETNEAINRKAKKALEKGLIPIICVGETLEEREKGITELVVSAQIKGVLSGFSSDQVERSVIAYEPVWAIGTGRNATPQQAEDVHRIIRKLIGQMYSWPVAEKVVLQYGGSVKPDNAAGLLAQPDIDGALVGGACLKAEDFSRIIAAASPS